MYYTQKITALTITLYESAARYNVIWFNVVFGIGQSIKSINQSNKSIILPVHSSICIFIYHQTSQKTDQTLDCGASCVTDPHIFPLYFLALYLMLLDLDWSETYIPTFVMHLIGTLAVMQALHLSKCPLTSNESSQ